MAGVLAAAIRVVNPCSKSGSGIFVVGSGCGGDGAVRQPALAVHVNVQRHTKVPLLTLPDLVHLGIARPWLERIEEGVEFALLFLDPIT